MDLLIRTDATTQIGTGHVMRCLALAQAWQDAGGTTYFAAAKITASLEARLADEGMALHLIPAPSGSVDDGAQLIRLAHRVKARWIVVDGYHFGAEYQQAIKKSGLRLLAIDDYGHSSHYYADLVLNQNTSADESLYVNREPGTELLLGTRYTLLRREFWPWRGWKREIPSVAKRVLITLGGVDPDNATLGVVQSVRQMNVDGLEARVLVGGSNPHAAILRSAIRNREEEGKAVRIRLEQNAIDMSRLMAWADLAISAGGSTCWELAFMGVPSLTLILADNQHSVAAGLDAAGAAVNLGRPADMAPGELAETLTELAHSLQRRAGMCQRGQELVDGAGPARVVQHMQVRGLVLRPAQADDCSLVWEWANHPTTRAVSFSSEPISWQDHVAWFTSRLADPHSLFYIAMVGATPIGQIRYHIQGRQATVSVSLAPEQRGRGYGSQIIQLASQQVFESTAVSRIQAYVKPDNIASACAFAKAGFVHNATVEVEGQSVLHFVLQRNAQL